MGAYTLLQDLTVATNSTSVVLNDFGTITKDDFVKIVWTHSHTVTGTFVGVRLLANSSVNANYHRQFVGGTGSSIGASRDNIARAFASIANTTSSGITYLKLSENDRLNTFTNFNETNTSGLSNNFMYTTSSGATFTSGITSLTFEAEQTNGIGTGSRIQIYKLAATKVRDIIVETNSTQVDIPTTGIFDPAIDKDSEYLLVSDIVGGASSDPNYSVFPNDLTTPSNYYSQFIAGVVSSASAGRSNLARIGNIDLNQRAIGYSHIKLSNIGAFTNQSYQLRIGTDNIPVLLANFFISSTAENITSITKLNIVSSSTDGIASGSRFTLYKLYE